jgi:hypothetical protein
MNREEGSVAAVVVAFLEEIDETPEQNHNVSLRSSGGPPWLWWRLVRLALERSVVGGRASFL